MKTTLISLALLIGGVSAAHAQTNCTTTTFMGTATTQCSDGSSATSNTFMGTTTTTVTPPPPVYYAPSVRNALPPAFGYDANTWVPR